MPGIFNTLFRYREKKSPDKLGLYPEAVDISAMPERRYLWTSRILVIFAAINISITMALASTIFVLLPLRGAKPSLFSVNQDHFKLERIQPQEKTANMQDLITEMHIEEYIKLRHEIPESPAKLYELWGDNSRLSWLSSSSVFSAFKQKATFTLINDFIINKLRRKVEFDWIVPQTKSFWSAQFRTIISSPRHEKPQILIWRAYLRVKYDTIPAEKTDYLLNNSFGFRVTQYSLSYLGTPEQSAGYLETAKDLTLKTIDSEN